MPVCTGYFLYYYSASSQLILAHYYSGNNNHHIGPKVGIFIAYTLKNGRILLQMPYQELILFFFNYLETNVNIDVLKIGSFLVLLCYNIPKYIRYSLFSLLRHSEYCIISQCTLIFRTPVDSFSSYFKTF